MTCEELLQTMNEYVDDPTILAVCEEFADHLAECNPCQVVVDNIRKTIALYKAGESYPLPPAFQGRLEQSLRAIWDKKFKPAD